MRKIACYATALMFWSCVKTIAAPAPSDAPPPAPRKPIPARCDGVSADLDIVTFNGAIAPGMNTDSTPRVPYFLSAVVGMKYDVFCGQEIWPPTVVAQLFARSGLPKDQLMYADTRGLHEEHAETCGEDQLNGLAQCAARKCRTVPGEDQTICIVAKCGVALLPIYEFDRGCFNCLAASLGLSVRKTVETCTTPHRGHTRAYEGANGIVLMSKKFPLLDREVLDLPSSGANKVALLATIEVPGVGPVELACTHLASSQIVAPTHEPFTNWDEEQGAQLRLISDALARRGKQRPQLLIGDMNFGPTIPPYRSGEQENVWNEAIRLGFWSPIAEAEPTLCNATAKDPSLEPEPNQNPDHVLVRMPPGVRGLTPVCAESYFEDPIAMRLRGRDVTMTLSDHCAKGVRFKAEQP